MSYNLFLDDLRQPKDAFIYPRRDKGIIITANKLSNISGVSDDDWVVVRSYEEFVNAIAQRGIPAVASFDHDLDEEHIRHYYKVTESTGVIEYDNLKIKTGKHCAEYFVQEYKKQNLDFIPRVYVHSANRWGAAEIKKILKDII